MATSRLPTAVGKKDLKNAMRSLTISPGVKAVTDGLGLRIMLQFLFAVPKHILFTRIERDFPRPLVSRTPYDAASRNRAILEHLTLVIDRSKFRRESSGRATGHGQVSLDYDRKKGKSFAREGSNGMLKGHRVAHHETRWNALEAPWIPVPEHTPRDRDDPLRAEDCHITGVELVSPYLPLTDLNAAVCEICAVMTRIRDVPHPSQRATKHWHYAWTNADCNTVVVLQAAAGGYFPLPLLKNLVVLWGANERIIEQVQPENRRDLLAAAHQRERTALRRKGCEVLGDQSPPNESEVPDQLHTSHGARSNRSQPGQGFIPQNIVQSWLSNGTWSDIVGRCTIEQLVKLLIPEQGRYARINLDLCPAPPASSASPHCDRIRFNEHAGTLRGDEISFWIWLVIATLIRANHPPDNDPRFPYGGCYNLEDYIDLLVGDEVPKCFKYRIEPIAGNESQLADGVAASAQPDSQARRAGASTMMRTGDLNSDHPKFSPLRKATIAMQKGIRKISGSLQSRAAQKNFAPDKAARHRSSLPMIVPRATFPLLQKRTSKKV